MISIEEEPSEAGEPPSLERCGTAKHRRMPPPIWANGDKDHLKALLPPECDIDVVTLKFCKDQPEYGALLAPIKALVSLRAAQWFSAECFSSSLQRRQPS